MLSRAFRWSGLIEKGRPVHTGRPFLVYAGSGLRSRSLGARSERGLDLIGLYLRGDVALAR
jgi:hypothetical protein